MHYVYIVKCKDETLYTGYSTNLVRRIIEHNNSKKGAKYTKYRRPVTLVYAKVFLNKREAYQYEYQIKQMTKKDKLRLITNFFVL
ncbi:MAG: GIY-YIG nuclease family protein [Culicoidibacterales bacterium]